MRSNDDEIELNEIETIERNLATEPASVDEEAVAAAGEGFLAT
jgi:hypothetical protein